MGRLWTVRLGLGVAQTLARAVEAFEVEIQGLESRSRLRREPWHRERFAVDHFTTSVLNLAERARSAGICFEPKSPSGKVLPPDEIWGGPLDTLSRLIVVDVRHILAHDLGVICEDFPFHPLEAEWEKGPRVGPCHHTLTLRSRWNWTEDNDPIDPEFLGSLRDLSARLNRLVSGMTEAGVVEAIPEPMFGTRHEWATSLRSQVRTVIESGEAMDEAESVAALKAFIVTIDACPAGESREPLPVMLVREVARDLLAHLSNWRANPEPDAPEVRWTIPPREAESLGNALGRFEAAFADLFSQPTVSETEGASHEQPSVEIPQGRELLWQDLVTLDQAAAMVHKSKRTLERYKTRGELPAPVIEGGGGRADLYEWRTMRPWLTQVFGIRLPSQYPRR